MKLMTASTITALAFTKTFEKAVEKFTEAALVKIDQLREKIFDMQCLSPQFLSKS